MLTNKIVFENSVNLKTLQIITASDILRGCVLCFE